MPWDPGHKLDPEFVTTMGRISRAMPGLYASYAVVVNYTVLCHEWSRSCFKLYLSSRERECNPRSSNYIKSQCGYIDMLIHPKRKKDPTNPMWQSKNTLDNMLWVSESLAEHGVKPAP